MNIYDYTQKRATSRSLTAMVKAVNAYLYKHGASELLVYWPRYEHHAVDIINRAQYEHSVLGMPKTSAGKHIRNLEIGTAKACQAAIISHYGSNT